MEKKKSWFNLLKKVFCSQRKSKHEKEGRRRFLFKWVQSKTSLPTITFSLPMVEKTLIEAEEEQKRHAFAAAIATTAVVEAAMVAAQAVAEVVRLRGTPVSPHLWVGRIRKVAAINVQTAFRGYLDYSEMSMAYRPSHADATYDFKNGVWSVQGGGRSSARETIGRVIPGAVAKKILKMKCGTEVLAYVSQVHKVFLLEGVVDNETFTLDQVESNIVRCPDPEYVVRTRGYSVAGVVACVVMNVPRELL